MRLPIGYALAYPERLPTPFGAIDWTALSRLDFESPDREAFPCLDLAYAAGQAGGSAPATLNGANEVAVAAFLNGEIAWTDINGVIEDVLANHETTVPASVDDVLAADRDARSHAVAGRDRSAQRGCGAGGCAMSMALRKLAGFGPGAGSDDGSPSPSSPAAGAGADGADGAKTPGASPPSDPPEPAKTPPTPANQRGALLRLLIFLVAAAVVSVMAGVGKTVAVVLAIILMIVLHEAGHFVMAKLAGIKVTEFFVGFGPRLWSIRRGETEYGVKALPLGGYVKIIGMNNLEPVDPADEPRTYRQQPYLRRLSVAVAGSAVHFLIALALLFTVFYVTGDRGLLVTPSANQVTVGSVNSLANGPSPAQLAGLAVGDRILAVDGQRFKTWDAQVAYIQARPNTAVDLEVDRHGQIIHLHPTTIDLSKVQVNGVPAATQPTGFIGFAGAYPTFRYGFLSSINHAGGAFVKVTAQNFDALKGLFSPHGIASYSNVVVDKKAADSPTAVRLVSPVGMVRLANQLVGNGLEDVLFLLILINLFVGMFNMIPLLPLDGGHVAIATYEAIRSRRGRRYQADVTKLLPFVYATLLIIVFLGASSLYVDVRDLLSIGF